MLFEIYHKYLNSIGIKDNAIIKLALDEVVNAKYRNPIEFDKYIRSFIVDKNKKYYIFLDEIQKVESIPNPYLDNKESKLSFVDVILGLMKIKNIDLYVTGSNSKMLSTDILTEFKDRGDEIRIYPLSFKEFFSAFDGEKRKQESNSLKRISDSFKKIIIVKDNIIPWHDDNGILYIGIEQFLLDEKAIDF